MSYNFLADACVSFPCKYSPASKEVLDFKFRASRQMEEISQSNADFMCFQEMDHIEDFYEAKFTELGYSLVAFR